MSALLELEFMQRALLAAALVGVSAPAIGIYLVQRRLSLMGDGIGHAAFAGVAAGLMTRQSPVITALIAACAAAVILELLRERGRTAGDVALGLIFYGGIALAVLLTNLADTSNANLFAYLFGSVLVVDAAEVAAIAVLAAVVLGITFGLRNALFAICYDEEVARASGLPVRTLNLVIALTAAVTVALAMRVVGVLLVSALLVIPVAAVQQVTSSFRGTLVSACGVGLLVSVGGLVVAYYGDLAPGATIVLGAIATFAVLATAASVRRGLAS